MNTEHFATIADALSPRYRLERLLQSGAAADVYLGDDTTLGRRVAVKVLRDEMAATVNAERFMSEIRVAAALRHPNIVPVYDSGDVGGLPYYVMPFIDGETLRARLARVGRLPLAETLRIAEDVTRALHFAHRHRVVHRDIKPENIMLEDGHALVLDFGIALALDALELPRHTLPGLAIGTMHYMSPEQVGSEVQIDGRSDIYSLACVVYEMLCGRPPFIGKPRSVMRRHLGERPQSLTSVCPSAPPKIGAALSRALQKVPDARFPTAGAFMSGLLGGGPRVRVIGRRLAVMPFVHVCGTLPVDTLSDSVGEEVAAALREFDGIVVTPEASAEPRDVDAHVTHIARRNNADLVLLGDVHHSANEAGVIISASLFDARTGRRVWAGVSGAGRPRDEPGPPISPAHEVARAIAGALGLTGAIRERRDRMTGLDRMTPVLCVR
jgi:serine/threonine protein kinase